MKRSSWTMFVITMTLLMVFLSIRLQAVTYDEIYGVDGREIMFLRPSWIEGSIDQVVFEGQGIYRVTYDSGWDVYVNRLGAVWKTNKVEFVYDTKPPEEPVTLTVSTPPPEEPASSPTQIEPTITQPTWKKFLWKALMVMAGFAVMCVIAVRWWEYKKWEAEQWKAIEENFERLKKTEEAAGRDPEMDDENTLYMVKTESGLWVLA